MNVRLVQKEKLKESMEIVFANLISQIKMEYVSANHLTLIIKDIALLS